jgi:hypothetical protein
MNARVGGFGGGPPTRGRSDGSVDRSRGPCRALALALCAVACLVSCGGKIAVQVAPEASDLVPSVRAALDRLKSPGPVRIVMEGRETAPKGASILRITSTPGWNLPEGFPPELDLPETALPKDSYAIPPSFAAVSRGRAPGSWAAVPLFFDPWGRTVFTDGVDTLPPNEWRALLATAKAGSLVMAGIRPGFRASSLFLSSIDFPMPLGDAASWFAQDASPWKRELSAFPAIVGSPCWGKDAWFYTRGDYEREYRLGPKVVFLETYSDYKKAHPMGTRNFSPLVSSGRAGPILCGEILFLEFRGKERDLKAAIPVVRALVDPLFHKKVGIAASRLSVNVRAPEIDGAGAAVRRIAAQASECLPVADRLPSPLVEKSLWTSIQLAADRGPRK